MERHGMPTNLRLTNQEQEDLRKKAIEINKILVRQGMQPMKDSELAHKILEISITCAYVTSSGEIKLDLPGDGVEVKK
ncbi:hypothetical protein [Metapseudomonas resinovorans]|uniref:Uncharacterized protein n=1 Tax=Metapseudomonas resinovorans NBRC 106553 TaxID=1245471 RepID=S6ART6_METRE|nr:hypothetical protein [Pseudomonas resinovorans]BAN48641.1 hypothetical protein PCA10_29090 [Pseudomonas resinovorans NBRC 106553]BAN48652.1 hypothetical protein PCA10_29200 [Pseudomonas resinovorans NBRC 106553]BAN48663.1 hypothetical protein PCA10_29310 [Pseudomonas resinovorans NBRC 106553]